MEEYTDRRYITFSVNEINLIDFNQVFQTSSEKLRLSIDESLTFVKYDLPTPVFLNSLTTKSQEYTYDEFKILLQTSDWFDDTVSIPSA